MKNILMLIILMTAIVSFATAAPLDTIPTSKDTIPAHCQPVRVDWAVQIASTVDPNIFASSPAFQEVIDVIETEKVCLKNGKVVYRILVSAEDQVDAWVKQSYYLTTRSFKDAFVVKYINGKRYN